jgi:hypothetical protein
MILKEIEGFENYFVSDCGHIYSKKSGKLARLKPWADSKGRYLMISLCRNGVSNKRLVHRLVASAFFGSPEDGWEVNHKDFDIKNNNINNLEWVTRQENINHMYASPNHTPVRNFRKCALYFKDEKIGEFKSVKEACRYASDTFGASQSSLSKYRRVDNFSIIILEGATTIPEGSTVED